MRAMAQMADALLRSTGGESVVLRMPAPAVAGDAAEQMGLAQPTFQDFALAPVTFRKLRAKVAFKPAAAGFELLVSASAVEKLVGSLAFESASVLFREAYGVLQGETLLRVESCTAVEAFGGVLMYRLLLQAPLGLAL
jgi:hypothetical protein